MKTVWRYLTLALSLALGVLAFMLSGNRRQLDKAQHSKAIAQAEHKAEQAARSVEQQITQAQAQARSDNEQARQVRNEQTPDTRRTGRFGSADRLRNHKD